jgi:hypothetical protein
MGFGLTTGFTERLKLVNTKKKTVTDSPIYTLYKSLLQTLSLFSLLCLHKALPVTAANNCTANGRLSPPTRNWLQTVEWLAAKLLMVLASRVILGSESHGTHDHILPSGSSGSLPDSAGALVIWLRHGEHGKNQWQELLYCWVMGRALITRERVLVSVETCLPAAA